MGPSSPAEHLAFQFILARHLARYPVMQLEDVYKLIHQASLGSHHIVSDIAQASTWLTRELAHLGEGPTEPTLDPISPDGRILRVHLRSYMASGDDPARLLVALIRTANEMEGSIDQLRTYWRWVEDMAKRGHLPFAQAPVRKFGEQMEALNYPAVHHSEAFKATYHPAYRVVIRQFLPSLLAGSS